MCILFVFGGQNDDEIIKMDSHFRYLLILRFIAVLIFVASSSGCFIVVSCNYIYDERKLTKMSYLGKRVAALFAYDWALRLPQEKCDIMVGMFCCVKGWERLSANKTEAIVHRDMLQVVFYSQGAWHSNPKAYPLIYIPS